VFFQDSFNVNLNRCKDKFPNLLTNYEKSIPGNEGNGLKHNGVGPWTNPKPTLPNLGRLLPALHESNL
jgi:hypothetical protein